MNQNDYYSELFEKILVLTETVSCLNKRLQTIEKDVNIFFKRDGIEDQKCRCGHQCVRWIDSGCAVYPPIKKYVCDMYPRCNPLTSLQPIRKSTHDVETETECDVSSLFE
jgi:hypothetical protein